MRVFVLLSCLALAAARPEAPGGYSYNRPSSGGSSGGGYSNGGSSGGYSSGSGGNSFSSGGFSSSGFGGGSSSFGGSSGGFSSGGSSGGFSSGGSSGGFSSGGSSSFGGGSSFGGYSGGSQQAIVQKHIYVHVPPPEQEEVRIQRPQQQQVAQKHYKIIFIKAPSPPAYQAPILQAPVQNEEKTLVYVLVKKPEEQQDIIIPTAAPTQPSKPEVYFIKYKTQKEQGGSSFSGASASSFGGAQGGFDSGASDLGISSGGSSDFSGTNAGSYGPPKSSGGPY